MHTQMKENVYNHLENHTLLTTSVPCDAVTMLKRFALLYRMDWYGLLAWFKYTVCAPSKKLLWKTLVKACLFCNKRLKQAKSTKYYFTVVNGCCLPENMG